MDVIVNDRLGYTHFLLVALDRNCHRGREILLREPKSWQSTNVPVAWLLERRSKGLNPFYIAYIYIMSYGKVYFAIDCPLGTFHLPVFHCFLSNFPVVNVYTFTKRHQEIPSCGIKRYGPLISSNVSRPIDRVLSICKVRWYCDAFLPLRCCDELWCFGKSILLREINTPIHQFWIYCSEKRDLTSLHSCRCRKNLLSRLKGCWRPVFRHIQSLGLGDSLEFWSWPLTGRHGWLSSSHMERWEMSGTVDLDVGKARCHLRFLFLYISIVPDQLILFSADRLTVGSVSLIPAPRTTRRMGSRSGNPKQLHTDLLYTSGKLNKRYWVYKDWFLLHKLTYSPFRFSGLSEGGCRPGRRQAILWWWLVRNHNKLLDKAE